MIHIPEPQSVLSRSIFGSAHQRMFATLGRSNPNATHIGLHISIVVLESHEEASFRLDHLRDH